MINTLGSLYALDYLPLESFLKTCPDAYSNYIKKFTFGGFTNHSEVETPWCIHHWGVETLQCIYHQGVETTQCIHHWRVVLVILPILRSKQQSLQGPSLPKLTVGYLTT